MAPLDGGPEGLLAGLGVPAPLEQVQARGQALEDLGGTEHAGSRGGQLDGQGQVVQSAAELGDGFIGVQAGPGAEQLHCLGVCQGRDGVLHLAPDPQQLPAGHQETEVGGGLQQDRQVGGRGDDLLQVVQHQEHLPLTDVFGQATLGPKGLPYGLGHQGRVANRCQTDPVHTALEAGDQLGGGLDGQAGLAGAPRSGQGEQARAVAQERGHLGHLPLPSHEG